MVECELAGGWTKQSQQDVSGRKRGLDPMGGSKVHSQQKKHKGSRSGRSEEGDEDDVDGRGSSLPGPVGYDLGEVLVWSGLEIP